LDKEAADGISFLQGIKPSAPIPSLPGAFERLPV
jgi:hypothetical protein